MIDGMVSAKHADHPQKIQYTRDFLLQFQPEHTEIPAGLDVIKAFHNRTPQSAPVSPHFSHSPYDIPMSPATPSSPSQPRKGFGTEKLKSTGSYRNVLPPEFGSAPQPPAAAVPAVQDLPNRCESSWGGSRKKDVSGKDAVLKKIKGVLNKLTPEKYEKFLPECTEEEVLLNPELMEAMIAQIFANAVLHHRYAEMYAQLCRDISSAEKRVQLQMHSQEQNGLEKVKLQFRKLLLERCQAEFEGREGLNQQRPGHWNEMSAEDQTEWLCKQRDRRTGNMSFVGQLYRMNMVTDRILRHVILSLLFGTHGTVAVDFVPTEDDMELLLMLLKTVGEVMESRNPSSGLSSPHEFLDHCLHRLQQLLSSNCYSSRMQFMIVDLRETRHNRWVPRTTVSK